MRVQIEDIGPFSKKISFTIPEEAVLSAMESAYRTLNRSVKLKGFRPGKVPRSILERYYKSQVQEEVLGKLIADSYRQAVSENGLTPVSEPQIGERNFEPGKDFQYSLTVEVKPEITVDGYLGLEVPQEAAQVGEEEVEARLKILQENHAQLKPLDPPRPLREKDFAVLDFEGSLAGKPLEGWTVKDHLVEVGSNSLVGALDEKLAGLSVNEEKDVALTLPENYARPELAGQEIQVHLRVKEIKEKVLPPLDDEFAKDMGDFSTLADLRSKVRETLIAEKARQAEDAAKEKLLKLLVEKHPFALPQSMIDRQVQHLIARTELRLSRQGVKLEEASLDRAKLRESFLPDAEKQVRASLILEKIAARESLSVSTEEMDARLAEIAAQINQRPEAVRSYYEKKDLLEDLRGQLLQEKTLDFLLKNAKIMPGTSAAIPEDQK